MYLLYISTAIMMGLGIGFLDGARMDSAMSDIARTDRRGVEAASAAHIARSIRREFRIAPELLPAATAGGHLIVPEGIMARALRGGIAMPRDVTFLVNDRGEILVRSDAEQDQVALHDRAVERAFGNPLARGGLGPVSLGGGLLDLLPGRGVDSDQDAATQEAGGASGAISQMTQEARGN
jgi:hypothetical protein